MLIANDDHCCTSKLASHSHTNSHWLSLSLSLCSLAKPLFPGDLSTPKYVAHIMNNKSVKSILLDER